jgi:GH15 family glucan-1,4-alpha-glucosidase
VDWLCFPHFDSPSVFGRLLGPEAGHWSIRPEGESTATRRYLGPTMLLETVHRTRTGSVTVTDALVTGAGERGHGLGTGSPGALVRWVECTEGTMRVAAAFAPRPEYGLVEPVLREVPGGLRVRGGADVLALSAPVPFTLDGATARAQLELQAGEGLGFALLHGSSWAAPPPLWDQEHIAARLADTRDAWASWSRLHQDYSGPYADLVCTSGRVLQALTFAPTGAIVAAPTTSLPEEAGGGRNWDYRYAWIRDASMTLQALWVAACPDEAGKFFGFLADAGASQLHAGDLQIMYGIGGQRDLSERTLDHLPGWAGSAPVRVGNAAWRQRQLDVYGELLGAAARLPQTLEDAEPETRTFLADAADAAAARWQGTDRGIWEVRGEPQHFLHSKLMCWVALDRAIALADVLQARDRVGHWTRTRAEIAAAIHEKGWNERANAYTQAFGTELLDASALMLSITGFLPGDDPRMLATIEAVQERLTDARGLVYRYLGADGLPGTEGTFLMCTFWLAHALALVGRTGQAREAFDRAASFATDLGLLAEEVAPDGTELLGNFPQAFSHIGLVNAAWAIGEAEAARPGATDRPPPLRPPKGDRPPAEAPAQHPEEGIPQ